MYAFDHFIGDSRKKFDQFFKNLINGMDNDHPKPKSIKISKSNSFPERGQVFDYCFEKRGPGTWMDWTDRIDKEKAAIPANAKARDVIVQTADTSRQIFFLETFLSHEAPLLFCGPTGTGKSALTNNYLLALPKERYLPNIINFSARTTASQSQDIVMSKLDRRRKGVYGPALGKKCVGFVDDSNMPAKEKYGAQPPIEVHFPYISFKVNF